MKRKSFLIGIVSLMLAVSLLSAPALADKGKEPQGKGKGKESTEQRDTEFSIAPVARVTALCLAGGVVVGVVVGAVHRSRSSGAVRRTAGSAPARTGYYRPAAKGETCGRMPEEPEAASVWKEAQSPVWQNAEPSPWSVSQAREETPAPMEEPAPVHPSMEENPFAAFEEFYGGYSEAEEPQEDLLEEEFPEEPEDDEPGDVYFKI